MRGKQREYSYFIYLRERFKSRGNNVNFASARFRRRAAYDNAHNPKRLVITAQESTDAITCNHCRASGYQTRCFNPAVIDGCRSSARCLYT